MHSNFYLSSLAACIALTMASSVKAAEPLPLQKSSLQDLRQHFHLSLPGASKAAVKGTDALDFIEQRTDKNQVTHIRMRQTYAGFPVRGGYAIVHSRQTAAALLRDQQNVQMSGKIYQGLEKELGQPAANFVKNGALALEKFKAEYKDKELSEAEVIPMVYVDENNQAHWAYRVSVFVHHYDRIPERPAAIVNAKTFKPFQKWDDIKTASTHAPVKGMGFGGNDKIGKVAYGQNFPLLELSRNPDDGICYMETDDVKVVDMEHDYFSYNKAMRFACQESIEGDSSIFWTGYSGNGYDLENGAFSPTNDAMYSGYVIKHMYHDWYGVDVLTKRNRPMQLVMRVHYGEGYENAYWDGKQMTFGDGDTMLYPLVSLGIGAHEISHGFTEQHSALEYYDHSGGMNEAFSDMAAQAAEFYSTGVNTWQIGAEIMKEDSGWEALRFMDRPSRDGVSINSADDYYKGLDVHYSSGVFNRLFYLMSTYQGWDTRKAFDVMVKANMDWWTPESTFNEGGCGVLNATRDLGFSVEDVKKSLDEVAINYSACEIEAQNS